MNDNNRVQSESGRRPVVVHPGPTSMEDLLRYVAPAPDAETEQFIAAIYADRREVDGKPAPQ